MNKLMIMMAPAVATITAQAAEIYVLLETGKNKNAGTMKKQSIDGKGAQVIK